MARYRSRPTAHRSHVGRLQTSNTVRRAATAYMRSATGASGLAYDLNTTGNYAYKNFGRTLPGALLSRDAGIRRATRMELGRARTDTKISNRAMTHQYQMMAIVKAPGRVEYKSLMRSAGKEARSARAQASRFAGQQSMIARGRVMGIRAHAGYKVDAFRAGRTAQMERMALQAKALGSSKGVTFAKGVARGAAIGAVAYVGTAGLLLGAAKLQGNRRAKAHNRTRTAPGKRRNVRTRRDSKGRYAGSY